MVKKKILIAYATYGSGHKTVANYVYNYFNKDDKYDLKIINLMDYGNTIGKLSVNMFNNNFKYSKFNIFTFIYKIFDHKSTTLPYKTVTRAILNNKKLKKEIVDFNPDLLISSHFFPSIILGIYNKKKLTNSKIITIITDYCAHEMWIRNEKNEDAIVVSNEIVKNELVNKGIDKNKIYPYGIPLSSTFKETLDKDKIKDKYHVNNGLPIYLFFAGGSIGSMSSFIYFKNLVKQQFDINIIFVCGQNEELKGECEEFINDGNYQNVVVLGFSKEVNNLLNIADVVITKPGGISITEALEMKKPMLLIPGNGGQENYNARFIVKNGFGINSKSPKDLIKNVTKLLTRPSLLSNINRRLTKYEKNTSIENLYKLADKLLKK